MTKPRAKRLYVALAFYLVTGVVAWFAIDDPKMRVFPVALLALLAVKSILWQIRMDRELATEQRGDEEREAPKK